MIPIDFISYASETLADSESPLSNSKIVSISRKHSIENNVKIPYGDFPLPEGSPNKRTVLKENILAFSPKQQYSLLLDLCDQPYFADNHKVKDLKIKLISRYGHLSSNNDPNKINESLLEETAHWLNPYAESKKIYDQALLKYNNRIFERNLLDDLRLSLELLLKSILRNQKSMENQTAEIGQFIQSRNGSKELNNMFLKLIDYYAKYHNTYVKHNDLVIENEIEIIFEMTSSFMKFLIRIK
jgi:hypothetical protein